MSLPTYHPYKNFPPVLDKEIKIWTPADMTTALWLDAADAATITESGGAVSQWSDKSGNDNHAYQSTESLQPTLSTDALSGLDAISFDGLGDFLNLTSRPATGTEPRTLFFVAKADDLSKGGVFSLCQVANGGGTLWDICLESGQIAVRVSYNASYAQTISITDPLLIGASWASGTVFTTDVRHNGSTVTRSGGTDYTVDTTGSGVSRIGYAQAQSKYFDGLLGELIFVSAALDTANKQKIEGYLAHKWGLVTNLPSDHPYKHSLPTLESSRNLDYFITMNLEGR